MSATQTPSQQITAEVTSWPGVTAGLGRRGEFAFRLGRRELGHLHGDRAAHFAFPKEVWAELRRQERIVHHPVGKVLRRRIDYRQGRAQFMRNAGDEFHGRRHVGRLAID